MAQLGAHILGDLSTQPRCEHPLSYWEGRDAWLDCREPDHLVSGEANFGQEVRIVVQSHDKYDFNIVVARPVTVHRLAFVASFGRDCRAGISCPLDGRGGMDNGCRQPRASDRNIQSRSTTLDQDTHA